MKKCGNCFRYRENFKDAKAKGLSPQKDKHHTLHSAKPRKGVKAICVSKKEDERSRSHKVCQHYKARWWWNLELWYSWSFCYNLRMYYERFIRVPIGGLRKPVSLEYRDSFDGMADRIIPNGEPVCPRCEEMPYSYEQCVFCGQRFIFDESKQDRTAPQREKRADEMIIFIDGTCAECGLSCGNGGYGPLRCRCGWVGNEITGDEEIVKQCMEELMREDGDSNES